MTSTTRRTRIAMLIVASLLVALVVPALPVAAEGGEAPPGLETTASKLAAGNNHTCALADHGIPECWGSNEFGQLGNNDNSSSGTTAANNVPLTVSLPAPATAIAAGAEHSCALLFNTDVYCWGSNAKGQLGNSANSGTTTPTPIPVKVNLQLGAIAITAGGQHTCAILNNKSTVCWGSNFYGQLGHSSNSGTNNDNHGALVVGFGSTTVSISAGETHTCAILESGNVHCWGRNFYGQLGTFTNSGTQSPNFTPQAAVLLPSNAVAITTGDDHTCVILDVATTHCWGRNFFGQLGSITQNGSNDPNPTPLAVTFDQNRHAITISGGGQHTCALLTYGSVTCWGRNFYGQLGNTSIPTDDNAHAAPGPDVVFPALTSGTTVATGANHSCAVTNNGSGPGGTNGALHCWGRNSSGQLGRTTNSGTDFPSSTVQNPIAVNNITPRPTNDNFEAPVDLGTGNANTIGTNLHATLQTSEPDHTDDCSDSSSESRTVWYKWTAAADGPVDIDLTGTSFDTILRVFTGTDVTSLTQVACDDDGAGSLISKLTLAGVKGTDYSIQVNGFSDNVSNSAEQGDLKLAVDVQAPSNDDVANAQDLGSASSTSVEGHNFSATKETSEPVPLAGDCVGVVPADLKTAWYKWTAPSNGTLVLDTETGTSDTVLATYTGSPFGSFVETGCDDESGNSTTSRLSQTVTAGTRYYIQVFGYQGEEGAISLDLAFTAAATPTPTTVPPTPTPTPHVPSGTSNSYAIANLEELEPGPNEIRIHGWSYDPDLPSKDLVVHVYAFYDGVGDPVALDTPVVRAADFRPDINRAFNIDGDHGFNRTLAIRNGNHRVCVYSLSVDGAGDLDGLNRLISCRYVTVTDEAPPRGAFDIATQTGTSMTVSGWAYDLDRENDSLDIQVFLDGAFHTTIQANTSRPDVNQIVQINGDHGFNSTFSVPAGGHQVCLYAIGVDPTGAADGENVLLNVIDQPDCRTT